MAISGWSHPRAELRVRTAMDRTTLRAKEKHLFAYEMIVPDMYHWLGSIDLGAIADPRERDKTAVQLREILSEGLHGWGKTKVSADVTTLAAEDMRPVMLSKTDLEDPGQYILTLQTPALLLT